MNFENIFKSIVTTLIGAVIMGSAYYGWYTDHMTDWQAGGAGIVGFALLWMRDQIPAFISQFVKATIGKFIGKKEETKQ